MRSDAGLVVLAGGDELVRAVFVRERDRPNLRLDVVERRVLAQPIDVGRVWLEGDHVPVVDDLPREAGVRADVGSDVVEHVVGLEGPEHVGDDRTLAVDRARSSVLVR